MHDAMIRKDQRGDTIVEVLICLAIMGMVVASSYAIANRSQVGIRNSQERAEATKLAEMQVERVRQGVIEKRVDSGIGGKCIGIDLNPTSSCVDGLYTMSVVHESGAFIVDVTWDTLQTGEQSRVSMQYRTF